MQQFLEVFSELKGKNFYLTGESVSIQLLCTQDALIPFACSTLESTFLVSTSCSTHAARLDEI